MAAGTVAYTDTTGNQDYLGMIAGQIGRRLKEASDMASDERAFAEKKAEAGGTSLKEAGIGKGYFFKRALGSRFGGDKVARTRGRLGATGPGTDPTGNFKTRFRGGFDYNVTNEIQSATAPLSGAVVAGLRGVEGGLTQIGQSIDGLAVGLGNLARAQEDAARQAILNGAFMQAFLNHMQREAQRRRAGREEAGLERGRLRGSAGSGRGMINVTPKAKSVGGGGGVGNLLKSVDTGTTGLKAATNIKGLKQLQSGSKAVKQVFRGQGVSNILGIGSKAPRTITKALANKNIVKALPGAASKANKTIVKAVQKSGLANTAVKGTSAVRSLKGVERLTKAVQLTADMDAADQFAKGMANLDMEEALIRRIYSGAGDIPIPKKQAAKGFSALVDGSFDGTARNTDEALAAWKYLYGEDQYKRLMGGADAPITKAMTETFTHKMLRAPGIPKAMARASKSTLGKTILKKIPVIAGIAGIIFGIQRALEGDFVGAGLEVTSGLLGATGKGAGLSLAIDGYLLGRDMGMMPMAQGGILTRPTPVLAGEAGKEGFFPLEGARGKKTFQMFGEGVLQAQKDNKSLVTSMYAEGNRRYYEGMNGWAAFGEALKSIFENFEFPNPFNFFRRDNNNGNNTTRPGATAGSETLDIGAGGGLIQGLTREDYVQIAKTIAGEAGPGDDRYLVAGAILNRVAAGNFPNTVKEVVQAGHYDGGPVQFEGYLPNANVDKEVELLMSAKGQASLVEALMRLEGRTDFKGQKLLKNRVAAEDPMFDKKGNYAHYYFQTGPNSVVPDNFVMPDFMRFIKRKNNETPRMSGLTPTKEELEWYKNKTSSANNGDSTAMSLLTSSGSLAMGTSLAMPVINNYYTTYTGTQGGDGSGNDFSSGFPSNLQTAFALNYSLLSKA